MNDNNSKNITITPFDESELDAILKLFRETVRTINAADYSPEQIEAWAPEKLDRERWLRILTQNIAYVAKINGTIVGFGDATLDGTINHIYSHKDYQGKGIGTALLNALEQSLFKRGIHVVRTEASISAKPFFEKRGYKVIKTQDMVHRTGMIFRNYVMTKELRS
jgi:putative acetyltransferase